jgi:hypothetical protein
MDQPGKMTHPNTVTKVRFLNGKMIPATVRFLNGLTGNKPPDASLGIAYF